MEINYDMYTCDKLDDDNSIYKRYNFYMHNDGIIYDFFGNINK